MTFFCAAVVAAATASAVAVVAAAVCEHNLTPQIRNVFHIFITHSYCVVTVALE